MARKYSKGSSKKVEKAMHEMKEGKLKSGRSGKKVTNPKQAVAIGLSEAREEGEKVPKKKSTSAAKKSSAHTFCFYRPYYFYCKCRIQPYFKAGVVCAAYCICSHVHNNILRLLLHAATLYLQEDQAHLQIYLSKKGH